MQQDLGDVSGGTLSDGEGVCSMASDAGSVILKVSLLTFRPFLEKPESTYFVYLALGVNGGSAERTHRKNARTVTKLGCDCYQLDWL